MNDEQTEMLIQVTITQWKTSNARLEKTFDATTEEQYKTPITVGSNTVAWFFCHLTSTADNLLPLLGLGSPIYLQLADIANIKNVSPHDKISKGELKAMWLDITENLLQHFSKMSTEKWLQRHTMVSEEDFQKESHRNKLNVLLSRISHQAHHVGQLSVLK